jgi:pantoate--beta-alanine ligase
VPLPPAARRRAPALYRALRAVEAAVAEGGHDAGRALAAGEAILAEAGIAPEYFAAVSSNTLEPVARITGETLVAIAANLGGVRLIDNVLVHPGSHER